MDLENFENDIFWQNFNTNLHKIIQINFKYLLKNFLKSFFENITRIFPLPKQSPKGVLVALINAFAPNPFIAIRPSKLMDGVLDLFCKWL